MQNINNHIDNGCPSPKATELDAVLSPKSKGKQKQEWSKLFQGGGDGTASTGLKKGKGKSRCVYLTLIFYYGLGLTTIVEA